MADFVHELDIAASPDSLQKLIAERGDAWWTTNALIDSQVSGSCEFRFPAAGFHASVRVMRNSQDLGSIICSPRAIARRPGASSVMTFLRIVIPLYLFVRA
jgi:hypothetical protein